MKGIYIFVFGILLSISVVRFSYGSEPVRFTDFMIVLKDFPLDAKEDFNELLSNLRIVSAACQKFVDSLDFGNSNNIFSDIFDVIKSLFLVVYAIGKLLVAFVVFVFEAVSDLFVLLQKVFYLIFGISFTPSDGALLEDAGVLDDGNLGLGDYDFAPSV